MSEKRHYHFIGICGTAMGSVAAAMKAFELNPSDVRMRGNIADTLIYARRLPDAIEAAERSIRRHPELTEVYASLGLAQHLSGDTAAAIRSLERAATGTDAPVRAIATLGWVYGQAGRDADATAMAERLNALATERHVSPMHHAMAAIGTGDHDLALTHLHAAVTERDGGLPFIRVSPLYDPLAEDPRFIELLTTIGLR